MDDGFDDDGGETEIGLTTCNDDNNTAVDDSEPLNLVVTGKQMVPSSSELLNDTPNCWSINESRQLESQQVKIPKVSWGGGGANCSIKTQITTQSSSSLVVTNCVDRVKSDVGEKYSQLMKEEEMVDITLDFCEAVKSMSTLR
jgi:hypothetical protein